MLDIHFEGWWQCRFATDPDPVDEPRGVSGPTFAVAGEPDLDRIIRLQNPVAPRYPRNDDVGVTVRSVTVGSTPVPDHPLIGALVNLLDDATFAQRNLIYVYQPFDAPIDPFHLTISTPDVTLQRRALWDVTRPGLTIKDVFLDPTLMAPRTNQIAVQSAEVAEATGFLDYHLVRRRRQAELTELLAATPERDTVQRAALQRRITAIEDDALLVGAMLASTQFMGLQACYSFPLNGTPRVEDPSRNLQGEVGTSQPWPIDFWLGGYDVDTMCGYMSGTLSVPFRPDE